MDTSVSGKNVADLVKSKDSKNNKSEKMIEETKNQDKESEANVEIKIPEDINVEFDAEIRQNNY